MDNIDPQAPSSLIVPDPTGAPCRLSAVIGDAEPAFERILRRVAWDGA